MGLRATLLTCRVGLAGSLWSRLAVEALAEYTRGSNVLVGDRHSIELCVSPFMVMYVC